MHFVQWGTTILQVLSWVSKMHFVVWGTILPVLSWVSKMATHHSLTNLTLTQPHACSTLGGYMPVLRLIDYQ